MLPQAPAKLRFKTQNIEEVRKDDYIASRDQNNPNGPLVLSRVERVFRQARTTSRIVAIRDTEGEEQVLRTHRRASLPFRSDRLDVRQGPSGPAKIRRRALRDFRDARRKLARNAPKGFGFTTCGSRERTPTSCVQRTPMPSRCGSTTPITIASTPLKVKNSPKLTERTAWTTSSTNSPQTTSKTRRLKAR